MQLNRYIPNEDLSPVLLHPLKFGDLDQIKALYELGAKIETIETEKAKLANGEMKLYSVTVSFEGSVDIDVLAVNAEDAKENAMDESNFDDCDYIDVDAVACEKKQITKT